MSGPRALCDQRPSPLLRPLLAMDTALTVMVVFAVAALAAAGAAAFFTWSRRTGTFKGTPRVTHVTETRGMPPPPAAARPGRTVEEERVRRTVHEGRSPADAAFADSELDDYGSPPPPR
ncbi:MAG: hypothetical protein QOI63_128 [Thermoplasmata archaeon]|nr:hypothetical protein [Thermoplasmata archaeon]